MHIFVVCYKKNVKQVSFKKVFDRRASHIDFGRYYTIYV